MHAGLPKETEESQYAPFTELNANHIKFYADFCWNMTEYWFAWHTFWINLLEEKS